MARFHSPTIKTSYESKNKLVRLKNTQLKFNQQSSQIFTHKLKLHLPNIAKKKKNFFNSGQKSSLTDISHDKVLSLHTHLPSMHLFPRSFHLSATKSFSTFYNLSGSLFNSKLQQVIKPLGGTTLSVEPTSSPTPHLLLKRPKRQEHINLNNFPFQIHHNPSHFDLHQASILHQQTSNIYCQFETFNATCATNQLVLMTSAVYGRMNVSRCIDSDILIGCYEDALSFMDHLCSGGPFFPSY